MLRCVTLAEDPSLQTVIDTLIEQGWAALILEASSGMPWYEVLETFPSYQFVLYEGETPVGVGNTMPFYWDGNLATLPAGWDAVILQGMRDHAAGLIPNALTALSATVLRGKLGSGISREIVLNMKRIARQQGLARMVAPVRPTWKTRYPLIPMQDYITWKHTDGEAPFDPWLRVHWRVGGRILKVAESSMTMWGTVAQWEQWAGGELRFVGSGAYLVPGALAPVMIDVAANCGVYVEPNVWMQHPLEIPDDDAGEA